MIRNVKMRNWYQCSWGEGEAVEYRVKQFISRQLSRH